MSCLQACPWASDAAVSLPTVNLICSGKAVKRLLLQSLLCVHRIQIRTNPECKSSYLIDHLPQSTRLRREPRQSSSRTWAPHKPVLCPPLRAIAYVCLGPLEPQDQGCFWVMLLCCLSVAPSNGNFIKIKKQAKKQKSEPRR